jgi:hypothetical protein
VICAISHSAIGFIGASTGWKRAFATAAACGGFQRAMRSSLQQSSCGTFPCWLRPLLRRRRLVNQPLCLNQTSLPSPPCLCMPPQAGVAVSQWAFCRPSAFPACPLCEGNPGGGGRRAGALRSPALVGGREVQPNREGVGSRKRSAVSPSCGLRVPFPSR